MGLLKLTALLFPGVNAWATEKSSQSGALRADAVTWSSRGSSIKLPKPFFILKVFARNNQLEQMIDLTRLLPRLLRANPELAVKLAWARAAGTGLARQAVPFRLDGGRFIVSVADAIWQKQLQSMSAELIFRLNNLLGQRTVDELVFRISPSAVSGKQERIAGAESCPGARTHRAIVCGRLNRRSGAARPVYRAAENCIARRDSMKGA
jgi:hypothetical protein